MPKKGAKRKKTRTHKIHDAPAGATSLSKEFQENKKAEEVPRSIVAKTSKVTPSVGELVVDLRKMMNPYTASSLKERSYNRLKDFASVAGHLNVSHLLMMSQTDNNVVLRIAKAQTGPTIHFRVKNYSLAKTVRAIQKRPMENPEAYRTAPLVVLNNFGSIELMENMQHVRLTRIVLQNMLPSINLKKIKLSDCRRVVLFNYLKEDGLIEVRHYAIRAQPVGISRSIKRVVQAKLPNLGELKDISEFLAGNLGDGAVSESEAEDGSHVELPERYRGRGNGATQQSSIKLSELGPRMCLELFKVEKDVGEGEILYHKFEARTPEEAVALQRKKDKEKMLKAQRKAVQEANVAKKKEALEEKRLQKAARKRSRDESRDNKDSDDDSNDDSDDDNDDELEVVRQQDDNDDNSDDDSDDDSDNDES